MRQRLPVHLFVLPVLTSVAFFAVRIAHGQQAIVFGPETFIRNTEAAERVVGNFPVNVPLQNFTISVQNGDGRHGRLSSAVVESTRLPVVRRTDFDKQADLITKPVSLRRTELAGG